MNFSSTTLRPIAAFITGLAVAATAQAWGILGAGKGDGGTLGGLLGGVGGYGNTNEGDVLCPKIASVKILVAKQNPSRGARE